MGFYNDYYDPYSENVPSYWQLPKRFNPYGSDLQGAMGMAAKHGGGPARAQMGNFNALTENYHRMKANAHPYLRGIPVGSAAEAGKRMHYANQANNLQQRYNRMVQDQTEHGGGSSGGQWGMSGLEQSPAGVPDDTARRVTRAYTDEHLMNIAGPPPVAKMTVRGGGGGGGQGGGPGRGYGQRRGQNMRDARAQGAPNALAPDERKAREKVQPERLAAWMNMVRQRGLDPNQVSVVGGDPRFHLVREQL